jgi:hypothetical protein
MTKETGEGFTLLGKNETYKEKGKRKMLPRYYS